MEICGNLMGHTNGNGNGNGGRDQNGNSNSNSTHLSWANNIWELNSVYGAAGDTAPASSVGISTRLESGVWSDGEREQQQQQFVYGGDHQFQADPHLTCLKLGKRHYFETAPSVSVVGVGVGVGGFSAVGKRGKPLYGPVPTTVPRCQVEGCHVALVNVKEYHRRHRVCEMHSKAPKVVVLGLEQRFCQQCSRFHVVSEFDDSKRSCRRRLAGHNERRRKSSHETVAARNSSQLQENKTVSDRFPYLPLPTGRALSLLSSNSDSWAAPSDLSLRSSAALRELIAENRAAVLARQLILDRDWHSNHQPPDDFSDVQPSAGSSTLAFHPPHVTLNLVQARSTDFGLLSTRGRSKEEDQECLELWNSFHDSHVV